MDYFNSKSFLEGIDSSNMLSDDDFCQGSRGGAGSISRLWNASGLGHGRHPDDLAHAFGGADGMGGH